MHLSKNSLDQIGGKEIEIPGHAYFHFPEKVLQFGTGVLLRGLPGHFIDKANKQGIFKGRIVMVKSTELGEADKFNQQDNLYTLCTRGIDQGREISENSINASVSRLLIARKDWPEILDCATSPDLELVISNTTEVGIVFVKEDIHAAPPQSFPGKLLAFLYRRYQFFKGDMTKGLVIIPTELIPDNGSKLLSILLEGVAANNLEDAFREWLTAANHFCSSLVDRIVPGKLPPLQLQELEKELGYEDPLMIICEPYRLWAIETASEKVKHILSFQKADEGVVLAADISIYRDLKLRLLNGSHTFTCGLAVLAGFTMVKEAMRDPLFEKFIRRLMIKEIAPAIVNEQLSLEDARAFSEKVLDRFRNPQIEHPWLNITLQYTSKMRLRNVPVIRYYVQNGLPVPKGIALTFAAWLLFMKSTKAEDGKYYGNFNGRKYLVQDDRAAYLSEKWNDHPVDQLLPLILGDQTLWGADLSSPEEFCESIKMYLELMINKGPMTAMSLENATA